LKPARPEPNADPAAIAKSQPRTVTDVAATEPERKAMIDLKDVGIWYRLRHRSTQSLKHKLLNWQRKQPARTFWALRHVDLTCYAGQVVGVVGHNGAGKSTLCMTLARILTPDEGNATINGMVTPLLGLGSGFHTEMTGRDNIFLNAAYLGIPREVIAGKVDDIIEFSELGEFIEEPIYTYSSGMRARLGFSVASMIEPEIMILDEVLGVGDRAFQIKSRERIKEMMKISKVIIIVSHSADFLRKTCTHCLWIDQGHARAFGEADAVIDEYERTPPTRPENNL